MVANELPQCLKITEKVSFKIASEASNIYIYGQKLLKMQKLVNFDQIQMRHFR